jgi:hypothetical protein
LATTRAPGKRDAKHRERSAGRNARARAVDDAERDRIRELHGQGLSCNAIAAELGRSRSTISGQCRKLGLSFDRASTRQATEAKVADAKARRAEAVRLAMDDWHRLRERAWSPYRVAMGTGEGLETITLELPPAQDTRAFYNSMSVCIKDQIAIEKHDADPGSMSAVDAWLAAMLGEG